ncbi:hypothetical protein DXT29_09335 [Enterococcus faecalis]|nr:hypothetical protein [Enterococcus faecalis]EGO8518605.1 hypothetical protein [Enterococcus faecalis]EGO8792648.1 hypothetical protein [Enterococcus faecalis]EGO9007528.1 hypothetical protein [Enterococcus faecalis]EGO9132964.1 hypothetical protein [Enterococcus faecalis]
MFKIIHSTPSVYVSWLSLPYSCGYDLGLKHEKFLKNNFNGLFAVAKEIWPSLEVNNCLRLETSLYLASILSCFSSFFM